MSIDFNQNSDELTFAVVDSLCDKLPENVTQKEIYDKWLTFSKSQRIVWALWWFVGEVENGGIGQFYMNGFGVYSQYLEEFLYLVGAGKIASLAKKAHNIYVKWREKYSQQLEGSDFYALNDEIWSELSSPLNGWDELFYETNDDDYLKNLLAIFIHENRVDFEELPQTDKLP